MIETVEQRLEGWKARILSQGGCLVLIKAVLSAIPTFLSPSCEPRVPFRIGSLQVCVDSSGKEPGRGMPRGRSRGLEDCMHASLQRWPWDWGYSMYEPRPPHQVGLPTDELPRDLVTQVLLIAMALQFTGRVEAASPKGPQYFVRDSGRHSSQCRRAFVQAWGMTHTSTSGWLTELGSGCCRLDSCAFSPWLGTGKPWSHSTGTTPSYQSSVGNCMPPSPKNSSTSNAP